ncbi:MAG: hypothetical protein ACRDV1_00920 [Actinomycetes bacterium]
MLLLLTLLTAGYFAAVVWVRRSAGRAAALPAAVPLPVEDQPPPSAVGWPPEGEQFWAYLDDGYAALDAYLAEGFAA